MKMSSMISAVILSSGLVLSFNSFAAPPKPNCEALKVICQSTVFQKECNKAPANEHCQECQDCNTSGSTSQ